MAGLLATVSFVIAAVIFFMLGAEWEDGPDAAWGFFFVALGLAIGGLGGAYHEVRGRTSRQ